jgi:hypothetical protein
MNTAQRRNPVGDQAIAAVRAWVERLPEGTARLEESANEYEQVLRIVPRAPTAAAVTIHVSNHGAFDVYLGSSIRVEDLPLTVPSVLEICDAVRRGRFSEETWKRGGVLLKAVCELKLESGDLRGTDIVGAFGTLGADEHTVTRYDAYDGADHRSRDGGDGA